MIKQIRLTPCQTESAHVTVDIYACEGWVTKPILSVHHFSKFSALLKQTLPTEYHVYINRYLRSSAVEIPVKYEWDWSNLTVAL